VTSKRNSSAVAGKISVKSVIRRHGADREFLMSGPSSFRAQAPWTLLVL
jgi:hypothetical protein